MRHIFNPNNIINAMLAGVVFYFVTALFFDQRDVVRAIIFTACMMVLTPVFRGFFLRRRGS